MPTKSSIAKESEPRTFMVRLKRYNKQRGFLKRSYTVFGHRFEEARGWYTVDEIIFEAAEKGRPARRINLVEYLRDVHQTDDPDSPFAFDVATAQEASDIDKQEARVAAERARARDLLGGSAHPNDLTSRETRRGFTEEPESLARRRASRTRAVTPVEPTPETEEAFDPDADLSPPV